MFKKVQRLIDQICKLEYAKASIYYVIANIIGQGVVLLSSAVFTRMMGKSDYGLVSTYSTWVLLLNTFICLNLFVTVRNAYIDFKTDYDNYNSSVLMLSILIGVTLTLLIIGIMQLLKIKVRTSEIILACGQSVALNIVNYVLAIQAMKNEYRQRAIFMIAPNWTHIILSIVLMSIFTQNLYMAKIVGNALGVSIFGVIGCVILFKKAKPKIKWRYWRYAVKISVPSIFNTLSDLILIQCDRLMLTSMIGAEETAEYSVIYNVSSIITAIYQAINGAWLPWFFTKAANSAEDDTRKYQRYYMLGFTVFTCGMLTVSPELIKIISPSNYWGGISYVSPIVVASYMMFLYTFLTSLLAFKKENSKIARNTILAAILNLGLNYLLIPQYKSQGAVAATVISYLILFLFHFLSIKKAERAYFSVGKMGVNLGITTVYGLLFYFVRDLWLARYMFFVLFVSIVYLVRGRKIIRDLIEEMQ